MQWYFRLVMKNSVLDSLIWETASPRTHKSKIVNCIVKVFFFEYWKCMVGFTGKLKNNNGKSLTRQCMVFEKSAFIYQVSTVIPTHCQDFLV